MNKKIFRGGKVVLPDRVLEASLVVEGERKSPGFCTRGRS